jgi:putative transposase
MDEKIPTHTGQLTALCSVPFSVCWIRTNPPSYRNVLRVLQPIVERKEKAKSIRSPGWRGATLLVKTHEGQALAVEYSNQVWQCDHTRVDVMLVDPYGEVLGRPRSVEC